MLGFQELEKDSIFENFDTDYPAKNQDNSDNFSNSVSQIIIRLQAVYACKNRAILSTFIDTLFHKYSVEQIAEALAKEYISPKNHYSGYSDSSKNAFFTLIKMSTHQEKIYDAVAEYLFNSRENR